MARNGSTYQSRRARQLARARDESIQSPCWICGQRIDYTLTDGLDCWEPDHFHTVLARPDLQYDTANLRPSHRRCNRNRGATPPDQLMAKSLGVRSRNW